VSVDRAVKAAGPRHPEAIDRDDGDRDILEDAPSQG
jgi:hypothetical protein